MAVICLNELGGIGDVCEQATPITITSGIFLTTPDFNFASLANFADEDKWKEGIRDNKIFPVQSVKEEENQDFEDSVTETSSGDKVFNFEGRRGKMLKVLLPLEMHKVLRTYDRKNLKVFYLDRNNNIRGTSPDGTKVQGYSLSYFRIPKQESPYPDNPAYSAIQLQELDINEWDKNGIYMNTTWLGTGLKGVLKVDATPSTITANVFTVQVDYKDKSSLTSAGAAKTAPVSGLDKDSFQVIDQTGAILDPNATPTPDFTVAESTTTLGLYTITAVAITSGSVQVIPSTDNLYKSEIETLTAST